MLFKNICRNTCEWKKVLKYMKCCLKTENDCLKTYTTHPILMDVFLLKKKKKKRDSDWWAVQVDSLSNPREREREINKLRKNKW